jgi:mRNA interferase MazF
MIPRRGEVWLVDFGCPGDATSSGHGAVVVSADAFNESRPGVALAVPLTLRRWELPSHIEVAPGPSGLEAVAYAKCEELRSVPEGCLVSRWGAISDENLTAITRVLGMLLEL